MSRTKAVIAGFVAGYVLAHLVYVVLALVAAVPGLSALLRGIKAAGLSPQLVFPLLTNYLPTVLTAFAVGYITYRALGGFRARLFIALAAPWLLMGGYGCLVVAEEGLLDCWHYSDGTAFVLGFTLVPLGLLLAGFAHRPPNLNKAVDTDAQGRPTPSASFFSRRPPLRQSALMRHRWLTGPIAHGQSLARAHCDA